MGKKFVIVRLVLLFSMVPFFTASAQDSVQVERSKKARFVFNFDTRYTLFGNDPVRVSGLKSGVEWHSKFRTGLGYYFLSSPIVTRSPALGVDRPATETIVKFRYGAVYGEYVILRNPKWELSVPFQAGYGRLLLEQRTSKDQLLRSETKPLWLIEPSVSGHYKVLNWVGIGAGIGYRQMLGQTNRETSQLNAPIYYIKAKLFVGALYRQFRNKYCLTPETI